MLEGKKLCVAYGKQQVLFDVELKVERGKMLGIIGPNGAGKSTLLKSLALLCPLKSGQISVDGESFLTKSRGEIARVISYLSQGREVPALTVEQAVLHGRYCHHSYPCVYTAEDRLLARRAMEQMGVADLAQRPMSSLSGGLRQRVYLATLWCQDSPFVLLDEPATYLDVGGQRSLMGSLLAMSEAGKGVVAVMHDLPLAFRFCHEIALLWEGRLLSLAEPEALCQSGLLEKVFGVGVKRTSEGGYAYRE